MLLVDRHYLLTWLEHLRVYISEMGITFYFRLAIIIIGKWIIANETVQVHYNNTLPFGFCSCAWHHHSDIHL